VKVDSEARRQAEHGGEFNEKDPKRIFGMVSRIVQGIGQEKPILTIDNREKRRERARKLLLRLKKEDAS
jgi:hypothetical protein